MIKKSSHPIVTSGAIIIGDEILAGRTQDKNLAFLATWLDKQDICLKQAIVITDDLDEIAVSITDYAKRFDYVFTSGGLGPTPDDMTVAGFAQAFGCDVTLNEAALTELSRYYGGLEQVTAARRKMAMLPVGAELIDNPLTGAPGFYMQNVFALAGIPSVQRAMLDSLTNHLQRGSPVYRKGWRIEIGESWISDLLQRIREQYPNVTIGSYPIATPEGCFVRVIATTYQENDLLAAAKLFEAGVQELSFEYQVLEDVK